MNSPFSPKQVLLLIWALCFPLTTVFAGPEAWRWSSDKPLNVVWITCEDIRPTLSMYGDPVADTPNLERLAREGVVFNNCFSVAGVCAPSRSGIATGMYPISIGSTHMRTSSAPRTGVVPVAYEAVPPPEVRFMSEYLRAAGYYCTNNSKQDYQFDPPVTVWDESSNQAHWRNREEGQPFFAIFNSTVTHESQLWARADHPIKGVDVSKIEIPPYLPDTPVVRQDHAIYYNNIRQMDEWVGGLLDELEKEGLLDQTIIFFYSDHGGNLPRQKRLMFDSGLHVPLIIRFPDRWAGGRRFDDLVSFVDFAPTVLSLTGIEVPDHMQGRAFLGAGATAEPRRYVYAARDRLDEEYDRQRAVRDKRYKYIRNYRLGQSLYLNVLYRFSIPTLNELMRLRQQGDLTPEQMIWFDPNRPEEELYDCWMDPHEVNNLAGRPEYEEILLSMRRENQEFLNEVGDLGAIPERRLVEMMWPGFQQPVTGEVQIERDGNRVTLSCGTMGASIGYRKWQGTSKPESWSVYTGPIQLERGQRLEAVAHRIGYKPSEVREW